MLKVIAISAITFFISLFIEVNFGDMWNVPGIGILFAVVVMGGFIFNAIEKKK